MEDYFDENFTKRLENQNRIGIWFSEPIKQGLDKTDEGISTKTVLTSSYTMKVYFK